MTPRILGWGAGILGAASLSLLVLVSVSRERREPPPQETAVDRRDPSKISDIELELILNKIREGDLLLLKNDLEEARRTWGEARRLGAGLWPIHEGLGDSFARAKFYDDAIREYETAEPLVPLRFENLRKGIRLKKAEVLEAAGRSYQALQAYLDLALPNLSARILEEALRVADRPAAEKLLVERARVLDPRVFSILAAFYTKTHRPAESAEALAHFAMAVAPWEEGVNRQAIEGLRAARKFDLALEVCRAWVRASPQAVQVYPLMGDLLREAGRDREAVIAYSSLVDVRPGDPEAHRQLGDIFRGMDRLNEAIAQYQEVKRAQPLDPNCYTTLISLYEARGDTRKAEDILSEGVKRIGLTGDLRAKLLARHHQELEKLKDAGKSYEILALRRRLAEFNDPERGLFDLKIIMTWDARCDVDLDVLEPGGEHVEHSHPHSKAGGHYYVDNTQGFGPEIYTLPRAPQGIYRIGAHLHGAARSTVRFVVILYENTPREERREETFVLDNSTHGIKFISDVVLGR